MNADEAKFWIELLPWLFAVGPVAGWLIVKLIFD